MKKLPRILLILLAAALIAAPQRSFAADGGDEVIAVCMQGLSSDDADWKECDLGDYVADAIREEAGTDISLIPAGCLGMALVGDGEITRQEAVEALSGDFAVQIYELSSAQLKQLLERGVSTWVLSEKDQLDIEASASPGYLHISGMEIKYDASASVGERVMEIFVAGNALDLTEENNQIRVSAPTALEVDAAGTDTGRTMTEMLCGYIAGQGDVVLEQSGRVHVIGANAANIITIIPPWIAFFAVVMIGMNAALGYRRKDAFDSDE